MELSGKHDIVIGAVTNYTPQYIRPWINSLEKSGFEGGKVLLCYNIDRQTVNWLQSKGVETCVFSQDPDGNAVYQKEQQHWNIVVERFFHYWQLFRFVLKQHTFRYIIATDVKDVIFQTNPSVFLEDEDNFSRDQSLLLSSENLTYENEPWGFNNLMQSFGKVIHARYEDREIVNCGVLAGRHQAMVDLFLNIALLCNGTSPHVPGGGGPDQAALNILKELDSYKRSAEISHYFSAQLGTTGDPSKMETFKGHHIYGVLPEWNGEYFIDSFRNDKYPIVHQWDRMGPEITSKIMEMYG